MQLTIDQELHLKWLWLAVGIGPIITISILCLMPPGDLPPPFPHFDKLVHWIFYLTISGWFGQLVIPQFRWNLFTLSLAMGVILEIIQWLLPFRSFELWDIAANTVGNLTGIAIFTGQRFRPLRQIDRFIWSIYSRLSNA